MKASYATWLTIGIFSLSWAAEETLAELPPGTYEMLKEEATEVLLSLIHISEPTRPY